MTSLKRLRMSLQEKKLLLLLISDLTKKEKLSSKAQHWKAESKSEIKDGQTVIIIEKDNFKLIVEPKK